MTFAQIEEAYSNYEKIEAQLTPEQRINYLRGFQELIRLFKSNMALEAMLEAVE